MVARDKDAARETAKGAALRHPLAVHTVSDLGNLSWWTGRRSKLYPGDGSQPGGQPLACCVRRRLQSESNPFGSAEFLAENSMAIVVAVRHGVVGCKDRG